MQVWVLSWAAALFKKPSSLLVVAEVMAMELRSTPSMVILRFRMSQMFTKDSVM